MSYNSLKTTAAAAAVISVGALAFSGHAEAYWRHHYHHRHAAVCSRSFDVRAGARRLRDERRLRHLHQERSRLDDEGMAQRLGDRLRGQGRRLWWYCLLRRSRGGSGGSRGLRLRGLRLRLRGWAPRRFVRRSLRLVRRRPARSNDVTGAPSARTGPSCSTPIPSGRCSRRRPSSGGPLEVAPILLESEALSRKSEHRYLWHEIERQRGE